jgi:hypothetical protein
MQKTSISARLRLAKSSSTRCASLFRMRMLVPL